MVLYIFVYLVSYTTKVIESKSEQNCLRRSVHKSAILAERVFRGARKSELILQPPCHIRSSCTRGRNLRARKMARGQVISQIIWVTMAFWWMYFNTHSAPPWRKTVTWIRSKTCLSSRYSVVGKTDPFLPSIPQDSDIGLLNWRQELGTITKFTICSGHFKSFWIIRTVRIWVCATFVSKTFPRSWAF